MTRNGILPKLHVHNVADERPIPDIITNFAKATAGATVGEMTKNNMFEGTQVLPILYRPAQRRGTFDCTQHPVRDGALANPTTAVVEDSGLRVPTGGSTAAEVECETETVLHFARFWGTRPCRGKWKAELQISLCWKGSS